MIKNQDQLSEKLITNQVIDEAEVSQIGIQWLSCSLRQLFTVDNLLSEKSYNNIMNLGGLNRLATMINTDLKNGIPGTSVDISHRLKYFGNNNLIELPQQKNYFLFLQQYLRIGVVSHLIVASLISIILNFCTGQNFGQSILILIIIGSFAQYYAFYTNYIFNLNGGNKLLEKQTNIKYVSLIKSISSQSTNVKRKGITSRIKVTECLVGDIVLVKSGDIIPGDGIILQNQNFIIRQYGSMERQQKLAFNQQISENTHKYFVSSLSFVVSGTATILLLNIGFSQLVGVFQRQYRLMQRRQRTNLKQKISFMQAYFDKCKLYLFVLIVGVLLGKFLWRRIFSQQSIGIMKSIKQIIQIYQISCICLVIGFHNILTIGQHMFLYLQHEYLKDQNFFIRHSSVLEDTCQLTDICVSNTGILTTKKTKIKNIMIGLQQIYNGDSLDYKYILENTKQKWRQLFIYLLCSTQNVIANKQYVKLFLQLRYKYHEILKQIQPTSLEHKNKNLKYRLISLYGKKFVVIEADFQDIFSYCSHYTDSQGIINPIKTEFAKSMKQLVTQYQLNRLCRSRILCYKQVGKVQILFDQFQKYKFLQSKLILVSLINLNFQLYRGVPEYIRMLMINKLNVKMLSGNSLQSCVSIAKQAHILPIDFQLTQNQQIAIQSSRFLQILDQIGFNKQNNYSTSKIIQKLRTFVKNVRVIARITMNQRRIFIKTLKKVGSILGTIGIQDKQVIDNAHVSITFAYDDENQCGNVIKNNSQVYGMVRLLLSSRVLCIYLSKLFKVAQTAKIMAIILILLFILFFSDLQFKFSVSILLIYSINIFITLSLLRFINTRVEYLDEKSKNIPILNLRNKKAVYVIILVQVVMLVGVIWFITRNLPDKSSEQYQNQLTKYSSMLIRCYFFFQFFHMISALKQNNLEEYFPELHSFSLSEFSMKNKRFLLSALFIYFNVQLVIYGVRTFISDQVESLSLFTTIIGGNLYLISFVIGLFIFYIDYLVDMFHWQRLWGQYYPDYYQHLLINQVVEMIGL